MAVLLLDMLFSRDSLGNQLAASAVVILLAAVMAEWGRRYPVLRGSVAAVLFALTLTGWEVLIEHWAWMWDTMWLYGVCADCVHMGYGEERQILYSHTDYWHGCAGGCPAGESGDSFFFLLLSVYLLVKSFGREGTARERFIRGSCLYSLAGVYLLAEGATANGVLRMVWTAAVYGLEYASVILHDRSKIRDRFWNCTGMTVFLMMMGHFTAIHLWRSGI